MDRDSPSQIHLHVDAEKVQLSPPVKRVIPHSDRFSCHISSSFHLCPELMSLSPLALLTELSWEQTASHLLSSNTELMLWSEEEDDCEKESDSQEAHLLTT